MAKTKTQVGGNITARLRWLFDHSDWSARGLGHALGFSSPNALQDILKVSDDAIGYGRIKQIVSLLLEKPGDLEGKTFDEVFAYATEGAPFQIVIAGPSGLGDGGEPIDLRGRRERIGYCVQRSPDLHKRRSKIAA